MKDIGETVAKTFPFSVLNKKELELVKEDALLMELNGQELLFLQGSPSDGIFMVVSGGVKLIKNYPGDKKLIVEFFAPGEVILEEGSLKNTPHNFEARPIGSTAVLKISHRLLKKLFDSNSKFTSAWLELVSRQLGYYQDRLESLVFQDVEARLASALLRLAKKFGKKESKGTLIALKITHQDLSAYIAASRETVSLTLGKFKRKRLLQTRVRWLIIPDLKALRKVAES